MLTQLVDQVLGLRHVVNFSIGEQEEHIVRRLSLLGFRQVQELLQEGSEQGGATQTDLLLHLLVGSNNVLHREDVRVSAVAIDSEAVAHSVDSHVARDSTKAENGEVLVVVVRLDHRADVHQSTLVLVVLSKIVERICLRGVPVRLGVVDCDGHTDLPASAQVINEGGSLEDRELVECGRASVTSIHGGLSSLKFGDCDHG